MQSMKARRDVYGAVSDRIWTQMKKSLLKLNLTHLIKSQSSCIFSYQKEIMLTVHTIHTVLSLSENAIEYLSRLIFCFLRVISILLYFLSLCSFSYLTVTPQMFGFCAPVFPAGTLTVQ